MTDASPQSSSTAVSVVLLAAGYGTRLYPLTKNRSKALLPLVGEKVILDAIVDQVKAVPGLSKVTLVTNHVFADHFREWQRRAGVPIDIIDDGTSTPETRLGAIRDLLLCVERLKPPTDVLVLGTDNLFTWSLADFVQSAQAKRPASTMAVREVPTIQEAKKLGIVELGPDQRIVRFVEKPAEPPSRLAALCIYYFPRTMHQRFREFLDGGGNPDAPGFFMEWLVRNDRLFGYVADGEWLDIGSQETYQEAIDRWSAR